MWVGRNEICEDYWSQDVDGCGIIELLAHYDRLGVGVGEGAI